MQGNINVKCTSKEGRKDGTVSYCFETQAATVGGEPVVQPTATIIVTVPAGVDLKYLPNAYYYLNFEPQDTAAPAPVESS